MGRLLIDGNEIKEYLQQEAILNSRYHLQSPLCSANLVFNPKFERQVKNHLDIAAYCETIDLIL